MQTKYFKCPDCGHINKVDIPENFDDKVQKFIEAAPATTLKGLLSLGIGIFVSGPVGFAAAGAMLAASVYYDGTAKCTECDSRFKII